MSKFLLTTLNFILISTVTMASSDGGHGSGHDNGVPKVVYYQAINVAIIFIAGFWFSRHKVAQFFKEKRESFISAQQKANLALDQAKHEHHDVKTKLDKLKNNRLETISRANADANDMHKQMLQDAEAMAKKLKVEAEQSALLEVQRVKNELRDQLVQEAFELSRRDIKSKATEADQKRLQENFINKVQVVQ